MTTDVEVRMDRTSFVFHDQERVITDIKRDKVAGIGNLASVTDEQPVCVEHSAQVGFELFGVDVVVSRQSLARRPRTGPH